MMRTVAALMTMLSSTFAYSDDAGYVALPPDATGLSLAEVSLVSVSNLCPTTAEIRCITDGTVVKLSAKLMGCLDKLGPVSTRTEVSADGKLNVYVSAINIHTQGSTSARCAKMPEVSFTVTHIPDVFKKSEVNVINLPAN